MGIQITISSPLIPKIDNKETIVPILGGKSKLRGFFLMRCNNRNKNTIKAVLQ
jgi:GTP-sensing pleiotropic transcriptional regulator CodY